MNVKIEIENSLLMQEETFIKNEHESFKYFFN